MPFLPAPAGLTPKLTEAQWMQRVLTYARIMNWRTYHPFDSRRSAAGFPDVVFVRRPRVVFAEFKADRGRLTADQRAWIDELRACGQEVYIWRPGDWPKVEKILR